MLVGLGALLLWVVRRNEDINLHNYKMERVYNTDALYRPPNYKGMSSAELQRARSFLDNWKEDEYQDPLTGRILERSEIDREIMRRAGGGGFIFIPPPVLPPVVSAGAAVVEAGWFALGAFLAVGVAQIWGWFNSRQRETITPEEGAVLLPSIGAPSAGGGSVQIRYTRFGIRGTTDNCNSPFTDGPFTSPARGYPAGEVPQASWERTGKQTCGYDLIALSLKWGTSGLLRVSADNGGYVPAGKVQKLEAQVIWSNGVGQPLPDPITPTPATRPPVPGVSVVPEPEPEPLPAIPIPAAPPVTPPAPAPAPEPSVVPSEPGPSEPVAPPIVWPRPPIAPPVPADPDGIRDGEIVPRPKPGVPVTDPDWHYPIPGGPPIPGNGPEPTLAEMAKELGRLELKLNSLMNPVDSPVDWLRWLEAIREALFNLVNGTTYTLTEECNPDRDPNYRPRSWNFNAPGAMNAFGVIENRLDALAAMVDQSLRARQQICPPVKPQLTGEWVTVNFLSDAPSDQGERRLRKVFRYRDQNFAPQEDHIAHWENFTWESGPVVVVSKNLSWGTPQVWAASADEGKRVIEHAAQVAGVDLSDPKHQWIVTHSGDPRYGRRGRMRVDTRGGNFIRVTKRPGPSGLPIGAVAHP